MTGNLSDYASVCEREVPENCMAQGLPKYVSKFFLKLD